MEALSKVWESSYTDWKGQSMNINDDKWDKEMTEVEALSLMATDTVKAAVESNADVRGGILHSESGKQVMVLVVRGQEWIETVHEFLRQQAQDVGGSHYREITTKREEGGE